MSADFSYEIEAPSARQVVISLSGELTASRLAEVEPEVHRVLEGASERLRILWDMRGVRRCDLEARRVLQKIQREIGAKNVRSAYLASRPRIRGVALWVVHTSGDELSRPFASRAQAMDWLELELGRMEEIHLAARELLQGAASRGGRA